MQIIEDYRALHRIPELGRVLPKTHDYLYKSLAGLPCQAFSPADGSICAWFDFGKDRTLAFRADIDALPVEESTGLPYASCHPGQMHACGHDGHTAILLDFARRITRNRPPRRNVLLIFQCAEETDGGAKAICDSGVLEAYGVEAVFGLHLWPGLSKGTIFSRKGAMMSRSCEVTAHITGCSAHITQSGGVDALAAGVAFYTKAQALGVRFGKLISGNARNCISGHTVLEGTLRTHDDGAFSRIRTALLALAEEIRQQTGCGVDLIVSEGYPAVNNPAWLYDKVQQLSPIQPLPAPALATEDFSFYQRRVPGIFFFLGLGDTPPLHAPDFHFDEALLPIGAALWETIAHKLQFIEQIL